jgi:murein DD-endopeptidase MepM/ murein hydrolase activator NlpD
VRKLLRAWFSPVLLAGLLPITFQTAARWPAASDWMFPVGNARGDAVLGEASEPPYSATRNVGGPSRHKGADLSNRQGGGPVRAAASGLVLFAGARAPGNGYGHHVLLAHRLPEGDLVYSLYAHLEAGSITVEPGDFVRVGKRLGTVGRTGVATSPHLHFEVRAPRDPQERWEKSPVVDPLAFVAARLPGAESVTSAVDTTASRP